LTKSIGKVKLTQLIKATNVHFGHRADFNTLDTLCQGLIQIFSYFLPQAVFFPHAPEESLQTKHLGEGHAHCA
jgi:hypothetical protein